MLASPFSLFVCLLVRCRSILELGVSFFPITLSLVRIEKDQISTKSVAFLHSYDLAAVFTNMWQVFEVCHSDE